MTTFEENIQSVKDQFYDIVTDKMYRFMEGKNITCRYRGPSTQFDMSNLSQEQENYILFELRMSLLTCFRRHFEEEDLRWLVEEKNIDKVVELLNERNPGFIFHKHKLIYSVVESFGSNYQITRNPISLPVYNKFNFMDLHFILFELFHEEYEVTVADYLDKFLEMVNTELK